MVDIVRKAVNRTLTISVLIFIIFFAASRKVEADDHSHDDYTEWENTAALPAAPGNYMLTTDVAISDTWYVRAGNFNICLNGHKITTDSDINLIRILEGGSLSIYAENGGSIEYDFNGSISSAIIVDGSGSLNLNSGTISKSNYGIQLNGGTAVLGDSSYAPMISNNSVGICSDKGSSLTINNAAIDNNDTGIKLNGKENVVISKATIIANDKAVVIDNSDASFSISEGTVKGNNYSFTSENNSHPQITLGDETSANDLLISGAISFNNEETDHLKIYEGYYDAAAFNSVKDSHPLAIKRIFVESDKAAYEKMVSVKTEASHIDIYNRDKEGRDTMDGKVISNDYMVYVNEVVTLTIEKKHGFEIKEIKIIDYHGNPVPYKTIAYDTFTFYMPDCSVKIYGTFDRNYRIDFDLMNAEVEGSPGYAFEGDEVEFSFKPKPGYELAYAFSDDVTLIEKFADNYSFKMPAKAVTVKAAYLKKGHEHDGKSFFLWERNDSLPAKGGSYVLTSDVNLNYPWMPGSDTDLCLNGHKVNATRAFRVEDHTLNLYDCQETGEIKANGYVDFGIVVGHNNSTFNMYGGTISEFVHDISSSAYVNIYKGKIEASGNKYAIDLSKNTKLIIGKENEPDAPIFIKGKIQYYNIADIKLNSGYYDNAAYTRFNNAQDKSKLFPEGKGFVPSGRTDEYVWKIGYTTPFNITIDPEIQHGTVSCEKTAALADEKVTLTTIADAGYEPDTITVTTDGGTEIKVTNNQFTMPADNVTVSATFKELEYTIAYDLDGGQLPGGADIPSAYKISDTPIILPNPTKDHYTFLGWTGTDVTEPQIDLTIPSGSTGNREYTANWEKARYWISFVDDDRTVLQKTQVTDGETPAYKGTTPTKDADAQYTYTFNAWTPEIVPATEDAEYTADYAASVNTYTITWLDGDGNILKAENLEYGATPQYSGVTPTKKETAEFTYTFNNSWDPAISSVSKNAVYTAQFDSNRRKYTITFNDKDGKQLSSKEYDYGTAVNKIVVPKNVVVEYEKEETVYKFVGWNPSISPVVKDATYTASYVSKTKTYQAYWRYNVNDELIKGPIEVTFETIDQNFPPDPQPSQTMQEVAEWVYSFTNWQLEPPTSGSNVLTYYAIFSQTKKKHQIRWYNAAELLETDQVNFGAFPIYYGDTPNKASDVQYDYTFSGWEPSISTVSSPKDYHAKFESSLRKYKITFLDAEGNVLKTDELDYGTKAEQIVKPADPSKKSTAQYDYRFVGWKEKDAGTVGLKDVSGEATYQPVFDENLRKYKITWIDGNNNVLKTEDIDYGTTPEYSGATPTKKETAEFTYTFNNSWDPAISSVSKNASYTAQFDASRKQYTVTFIDDDGSTIKEATLYDYGTKASEIEKPADPSKEPTVEKTYTFVGWKKEGGEIIGIEDVKGNATYRAVYSEGPRIYQVTFDLANGEDPVVQNYAYGSTPVYEGGTPTKPADAQYEYTFKAWDPAITEVKADQTYKATYDQTARVYQVGFVTGVYDPIDAQSVSYGGKVSKPETPSEQGYDFGGWYKDSQYSEPWNFDEDTVTGDTLIYLKAIGKTFKVTFDPNGGTLPQGKDVITITYGSPYGDLPVPEKDGMTFDGWYTDKTFRKKIYSQYIYDILADSSLVARYKYEVTFKEVDGTTNTAYAYEERNHVADPGKASDKNGYVFDYWVTSSTEKKFDFINDKTVPGMVLVGKYHRYAYDGNEQTWILNDKGQLSFRFVRYEHVFRDDLSDLDPYDLFIENNKQLFVDNALLDPAYYGYGRGSLIIDLKDSYLNYLSVGGHSLTVKFKDGEAGTTFYVKERVKPSTHSYVMPKTGN